MGVFETVSPLQQLSHVAANFRASEHNALWLTMAESAVGRSQNFSPELLHDVFALNSAIHANGVAWVANGAKQPIHYVVLQSAHPDYFSLGGDLAYFRDCIRRQDHQGLRDYSMLCVDMIYQWSSTLSQHATTVALVQGRALGGGFETALASDFIIAEEQSEFGFPEILFGLFPCTGGMSLLCQRVSVHQAERMMSDGKIYSAAELKALGVVDEICPRGKGALAVENFISEHARHRTARLMLQRGRHRLAPLNYMELQTVVGEWVEAAMGLSDDNLRVLDMLIQMQRASVIH
jgi:DSF synthase